MSEQLHNSDTNGKNEVCGHNGWKTMTFCSRWRVITTLLSVHSYHVISAGDLYCEWRLHLFAVRVGALLFQPVRFLSSEESKRKMEKKMRGQQFLFFLGTLISFLSLLLKTWPGPWTNSRLDTLVPSLFLQARPICVAGICLFSCLCSAENPVSVNCGTVCVCVPFFCCVWHVSYWTLAINLWPPRSLSIKRSDTK